MSVPAAPATDHRTVRVETVMGTAVSFDLRGDGDHDGAVADAIAWFHDVDRRFSTYRADSLVSRFADGGAVLGDPDLAEVVEACERFRSLSNGAFDAGRGAAFDPSAFVKGWSVDRAGEILRAHGCERWSMNAGGDVLVSSEGGLPWRIGVQHPFDRGSLGMVLEADHLAVATSALTERGEHIRDPRTGRAAAGSASATVCGPLLGVADALATAAFVLGVDGPAWVAGLDGYECWSVLPDGRVLATAGFPQLVHGVPVRTTSAAAEPVG